MLYCFGIHIIDLVFIRIILLFDFLSLRTIYRKITYFFFLFFYYLLLTIVIIFFSIVIGFNIVNVLYSCTFCSYYLAQFLIMDLLMLGFKYFIFYWVNKYLFCFMSFESYRDREIRQLQERITQL